MNVFLVIIWALSVLSVVFLENKNPDEAILWVLVLSFIPYFGIILYLAFGNTMSLRITRFIRKRRFTAEWRKIAYNSVQFTQGGAVGSYSTVDSSVIHFNQSYNQCPLSSCTSHEIFTGGEAHYARLFEDIKNAEESIHVLFYTIHNDETGRAFVDALTAKAREGVKVWVMFDALVNMSSPPSMYKELKKAGGVVKRLKPFMHQFRSHRKIVIIDSKFGYIGGMNIGNKYRNVGSNKTPWRDTQIRLEGECICELEELFLNDWVGVIGKKQCLSMIPEFMAIPAKVDRTPGTPCQFVSGGVGNDLQAIKMCYLSMIRSAQHSIKIQTPYFIPDRSILEALQVAASSGVSVDIMVPGIKSSFFLEPETRYYCGQMLKVGARIWQYKGYVHAKTMTIDDELCCIGSVNMDVRSLCIDDEICGVFYGNDLVNDYLNLFAEDCQNSDEYILPEFEKRGMFKRFEEHFFRLFAPFM